MAKPQTIKAHAGFSLAQIAMSPARYQKMVYVCPTLGEWTWSVENDSEIEKANRRMTLKILAVILTTQESRGSKMREEAEKQKIPVIEVPALKLFRFGMGGNSPDSAVLGKEVVITYGDKIEFDVENKAVKRVTPDHELARAPLRRTMEEWAIQNVR